MISSLIYRKFSWTVSSVLDSLILYTTPFCPLPVFLHVLSESIFLCNGIHRVHTLRHPLLLAPGG